MNQKDYELLLKHIEKDENGNLTCLTCFVLGSAFLTLMVVVTALCISIYGN